MQEEDEDNLTITGKSPDQLLNIIQKVIVIMTFVLIC